MCLPLEAIGASGTPNRIFLLVGSLAAYRVRNVHRSLLKTKGDIQTWVLSLTVAMLG